MLAIGIDIGGTSIKGCAVTEEGKTLDVFSMPLNKGDKGLDIVNNLIKVTKEYLDFHGYDKTNTLGIGIGIPGSIDSEAGVIDYSNNIDFHDLPIVKMFNEVIDLPVKITNDANAAALGEARFGAGKDFKNIIMLTLGTGVGGGIIVNGKLFEGNKGKGAELGHIIIELNGRQCSCGRKGCLEAYASATALVRDTLKAMEDDQNSLMWKISEENGKVDGRTAFEASKKGDPAAIKVVENYVSYLAEGMLNYFNIFRPDALILSGGIANQGEYLTEKLKKYCEERNYGYNCTPKVEILVSKLGYDSGKIGAASLFFE